MTQKVDQLFLELCLLRMRYSSADIDRVSKLREVDLDPSLRKILGALRSVEAGRAPLKAKPIAGEKTTKNSPKTHEYVSDAQTPIERFVKQLETRTLLRAQEQISEFARSIDVGSHFSFRREIIEAIKKRLSEMPPELALEKIANARRRHDPQSGPYLELAKTLMGT